MIIIDAVNLSLREVKDFVNNLIKGLTDRGFVRRVIGYKLLEERLRKDNFKGPLI